MKLFSLRATISFLECSRACHSSREFQHNMVKILLCRLRSNKIEKNSSTVFCSTFYWFFNEFFSVFLLRYYTSSLEIVKNTLDGLMYSHFMLIQQFNTCRHQGKRKKIDGTRVYSIQKKEQLSGGLVYEIKIFRCHRHQPLATKAQSKTVVMGIEGEIK